jgi:hypothetical protein
VTKKEDENRKKILARRATFVAAALAGVSTACGKEPAPPPQPCLSVVPSFDAGPEPCLSPVPPESPDETGTPADAGAPDAPPAPCLRVVAPPQEQSADAGPKPPPRPCLKIVPPQPTDGGPKPPPLPCLTPVRPK